MVVISGEDETSMLNIEYVLSFSAANMLKNKDRKMKTCIFIRMKIEFVLLLIV